MSSKDGVWKKILAINGNSTFSKIKYFKNVNFLIYFSQL